jgi:hypothetical protein
VIASAPFLLRERRVESAHRGFDLAGGFSITASLALLVYALGVLLLAQIPVDGSYVSDLLTAAGVPHTPCAHHAR